MPEVPQKQRKPWKMRWVVLSIVVFIPIYTYLTLHYRRPGPAFAPYGDMRDRADVLRLLKGGYQRVALEARRPADLPSLPAAPAEPGPGGLPESLKKTLVETPLMALDVTAVSAPAQAVSSIDYPVLVTFALRDNKRQLSGAHLYVREGEVVIVPDFEPLGGALLARTREGTALLTVPPGVLKPGTYRATVVGEKTSRAWSLTVR
jgi:hypothetical protein